ncbi:MAG: hypothetical protein Ct9H90mP14_3600 [Methanobacteriota archaeon]|nr:MAG: hypothetical protein Ct9H90mP14_3600 [Euryarchaeota archaeon]
MSAEALELLHPQVRELVEQRGWKLTPVKRLQPQIWAMGRTRILVAPTGREKLKRQFFQLLREP